MANPKELHGAANRINRSLQHRLCEMKRFGESKHEAKEKLKKEYIDTHGSLKGYNPARVEGIFSIRTMQAYRQTAREFSQWAAEQGFKNANKITRGTVGIYLQERQQKGMSPSTVSKDMAALNKMYGYALTKRELNLSVRKKDEFTRSRKLTDNDKRNFSMYKDQISFAKATGCRRQSVLKVKPSDFLRNARGKVVAVTLTEKGGKERTAPVLNEYKNWLTAMVNSKGTPDEPMFKEYDSHIDNHAFRAEYAAALLKQLETERSAGKPLFDGDLSPQSLINLRGKDAERDSAYRGYDRDIVAMVSGALGHNRLCIVFDNYIY